MVESTCTCQSDDGEKRMRSVWFVLVAPLLFLGLPANADPYKWCAVYRGTSSESCYFMTIEQCQASVSGRGGFCRPNYYNNRQRVQPGDGSPVRRRVPR